MLCLCAPAWAADSPAQETAGNFHSTPIKPQVAIIIDDLGYSRGSGELAAQLPGAVTLSVLPRSPHGRHIAYLGHQLNKEIMLHVPMSSILNKPLDPGGLTIDMSKAQFLNTLEANLADLPFVKGLNNHMGSELTQYREPMTWLMESLRERELYFVDSRTIASSLALETARGLGLPSTRRDIFLDNDTSDTAIAEQFDKLLIKAKNHGHAVAIAHPYAETLRFLSTTLPTLETAGYELVAVSTLLQSRPVFADLSHSNSTLADSEPKATFKPSEDGGAFVYLAN